MIGLLFTVLGIFLYCNGNRRWGVFLFLCQAFNYLNLIPPSLSILAGYDWAFIQMLVLLAYSNSREKKLEDADDSKIVSILAVFAGFILCGIVFSMVHLGVTPFNALAACRQYLLFPSYYFLRKLEREEFEWIMKLLFIIAIIHSLLYIVEVTTGIPILGGNAIQRDSLTGKFRYLNGNPLAQFFLYLSVFFPNYYNDFKLNKYGVIIFLGALFCTLTRTNIIINLLLIFYGLYLQKRGSNFVKVSMVLCLLYLPFGDALEGRFGKESHTDSDIAAVLHGDFVKMAHTGMSPSGGSQTMLYRIAWIYERGEYMVKHSLGESIFGLGFEYDPKSLSDRYHFKIGLPNEYGKIEPRFTPDIAYGNLLANFGFVGLIIFMMVWVRIYQVNKQRMKTNMWAFVGTLFVLNLLGTSFSSTKLNSIGFLVFMLFLTAQSVKEREKEDIVVIEDPENNRRIIITD